MKGLSKFQAFVRGCMIGLSINLMVGDASVASPAGSGAGDSGTSDPQSITAAPTIEDAQSELFGTLFGTPAPSGAVEFDVAWADGERSIAVAVAPTGEQMAVVLAERREVELLQPEVVNNLTEQQLAQLISMQIRAEMCVGAASAGGVDLWITAFMFTGTNNGGATVSRLVVVQTNGIDGAEDFVLARAQEKNSLQSVDSELYDPSARQAGGGVQPWGYWRCVGHVLKCEVLALGCLAAVPAGVVGCTAICVETALFGCVACILFAAGSTVALCQEAWDCIVTGRSRGCIP